MKGTVSGQPCTIRAPLQSLLPTEFVARQVKFPASLMSTLLISKEAVPSTKAILYLSEEATSLPSLNQDTLMGREPAILQSSLQVPLTTLSTFRRGLVKNGALSRLGSLTCREPRHGRNVGSTTLSGAHWRGRLDLIEDNHYPALASLDSCCCWC